MMMIVTHVSSVGVQRSQKSPPPLFFPLSLAHSPTVDSHELIVIIMVIKYLIESTLTTAEFNPTAEVCTIAINTYVYPLRNSGEATGRR